MSRQPNPNTSHAGCMHFARATWLERVWACCENMLMRWDGAIILFPVMAVSALVAVVYGVAVVLQIQEGL